MSMAAESNKAKIAKRVIEVLDYFDDQHREATVMDIVRRYNRPQSSTSELLSSLVDLGLLYKDPYSRSYSLTPRAAMIGSASQPELIRNGNLTAIIDRLVAQTGLNVAVFGMVGLNVQVFGYKAGTRQAGSASLAGITKGLQDRLSNSAAGWMLLSTIPQPRRDGMIRRLNAEAPDEQKFATADMSSHVGACIEFGAMRGASGFGANAEICCILLPGQPEGRPMAIGFVYEPSPQVDAGALLVDCLREGVRRELNPQEPAGPAPVQRLHSAA